MSSRSKLIMKMLSDADLVESSIRIELQHRTTWQRTRQLFFPPTHFRWRGGKQKPQETVTFQGVDIWLRGQDLNLRPSGYEPDELPGCSTPRYLLSYDNGQGIALVCSHIGKGYVGCHRKRNAFCVLTRFGSDLLSHVLRRSTIGATVLNGRVRDGIGCFTRAIATKP